MLLYGNGKRGIAEITHLNAFLEHICIINAEWKRRRLFYRREVGEVCRKRGLFGGLFNNNMNHVFEGLSPETDSDY